MVKLDFDTALDAFSAGLNMFSACDDAINVALVSLNVVATLRRMASGGADYYYSSSLTSACNVTLLEAHQASLFENALSLCVQTLSDLEKKKPRESSKSPTAVQHQFNAVKRTILLSQAQLCLDFGVRLAATLEASLRANASYSMEKHLRAANSVLEHFRNAASLVGRASTVAPSRNTGSEGERVKSMALLLSGRFYGQLAGFFAKPERSAHVMAAATSDWKKRARLNLELAKRSFGKAMEVGSGGGGGGGGAAAVGERARLEREELVARLKGHVR